MRLLPLAAALLLACGGKDTPSTDTGAATGTGTGSATGTGTGTATGTGTGTGTGNAITNSRKVVLVDVSASGDTLADVSDHGGLCPSGTEWIGVYLDKAQCLTVSPAVVAAIGTRPDGTTTEQVGDMSEMCPADWTYDGEVQGNASCRVDGDGTIATGTPCPDGATALGLASSPQNVCFYPDSGAWFYTWYNAAGEHFSEVSAEDMCPAGFGVSGIGCYRSGPGTVVGVTQTLEGALVDTLDNPADACPAGSQYVGAKGEFVWATCVYDSVRATVSIVEDAQGRVLGMASAEELCPAGMAPVGYDASAVIRVEGA